MKLRRTIRRRDMYECVLCGDAPCDAACPRGLAPAQLLRSIWLDNESYVAAALSAEILAPDARRLARRLA